jgi:archaellum component FlaC
MSVEEIKSEVEQLRHQVNGLKGRCSLVSDTITQLEKKYELSKNFAPPKRYELMKKMVQKVINDQFI